MSGKRTTRTIKVDYLARVEGEGGLTVTLRDGSQVKGFVCEAYAVSQAQDISSYGGWRNYLARHR